MPARQERCKPDKAVHFRPAPSGRAPARILPPTQTAAMLARQALRTIFSNTSTALSSSGHSTMFDAGALRVDQQGVELKARREDADRQAERFATACGAQPERLGCRDLGAGDAPGGAPDRRVDAAAERPRGDHGEARAVEQGRRIAARDVGAQSDMDALVESRAQRKHRVGEIEIRQRAMRYPGAGDPDGLPCPTRRRNSNAPGWSFR